VSGTKPEQIARVLAWLDKSAGHAVVDVQGRAGRADAAPP
jgi:hypothetical protein